MDKDSVMHYDNIYQEQFELEDEIPTFQKSEKDNSINFAALFAYLLS